MFELPTEIQSSNILPFLEIVELCKLDTAMCNVDHRKGWLECLKQTTLEQKEAIEAPSVLMWTIKRSIRQKCLSASALQAITDISAIKSWEVYLCEVGKHVEVLIFDASVIQFPNSPIAPLFVAHCSQCRIQLIYCWFLDDLSAWIVDNGLKIGDFYYCESFNSINSPIPIAAEHITRADIINRLGLFAARTRKLQELTWRPSIQSPEIHQNIPNELAIALANNPGLHTLTVTSSRNQEVDQACLNAIVAHGAQIKALDIESELSGADGARLSELSLHSSNLEAPVDDTLQSLAKHCPNLETLSLFLFYTILDRVDQVAFAKLKHFKCGYITMTAVRDIVASCPSLTGIYVKHKIENLNITTLIEILRPVLLRTKELSYAAWGALLPKVFECAEKQPDLKFPSLEIVNICDDVCDEYDNMKYEGCNPGWCLLINVLSAGARNVREVVIVDCLSSELLDFLARSCPNLRYFQIEVYKLRPPDVLMLKLISQNFKKKCFYLRHLAVFPNRNNPDHLRLMRSDRSYCTMSEVQMKFSINWGEIGYKSPSSDDTREDDEDEEEEYYR